MQKRFTCIWFRYLLTDWLSIRQPALRTLPVVLVTQDHNREVITNVNAIARGQGIHSGMVLADARAILPGLHVVNHKEGLDARLLTKLAEWSIRFTPVAAIAEPDCLLLDVSGCTHLWGGDQPYITDINNRFKQFGYEVRTGMADTIGAAWAIAHFGQTSLIIKTGCQLNALLPMPPAALRLDNHLLEQMQKLGLQQVDQFVNMPRTALRRRFGVEFIQRLQQALGQEEETLEPVHPVRPFYEHLPCLEPVSSCTGIEIALQQLLGGLCKRLQQEQKGLRTALFKGYRVDGKIETIEIGTSRPSFNQHHLFKLFEPKIAGIEPALGIELFTLEAPKTEPAIPLQEKLWEGACALHDIALAELVDRIENKIGSHRIQRYLPDEHHWPERSFKTALSLQEAPAIVWNTHRPRPVHLLPEPEKIDVTAPVPDYPPLLFRYKGKLHTIKKADGPERIEREWWIEEGQHRDYYMVEDEEGQRYWLFRLGHYEDQEYQWFIHGFFA